MNPDNLQIESGYAPIPNAVLEALARGRFSCYERNVLDVIFRKTYGWSKKSDIISLSQFVDATGIARQHIFHTLKKLVQRNIIFKTVACLGYNKPATYEFNEHFGTWLVLPKQATVKISLPIQATAMQPRQATTISREDTTSKRLEDKEGGAVACLGYDEVLPDLPEPKHPKVKKDEKVLIDAYAVLAYLNDKAHHHYRASPNSVIEILKRLKAGATVPDLELIIDYKVYEWGSSPLAKNLNNETLFRDCHYANYLEAAQTWDVKRKTGANTLMMDVGPAGPPMTKEERQKAKAVLFEGFGDGPDGEEPIQLEDGHGL